MLDKPDRSFRNAKKADRREEAKLAICAMIDEGLPGSGDRIIRVKYYQGGVVSVTGKDEPAEYSLV
jgi:hypothetical protein